MGEKRQLLIEKSQKRNVGGMREIEIPHQNPSLRCYRQRVQMGGNGAGQHFKEKQDM